VSCKQSLREAIVAANNLKSHIQTAISKQFEVNLSKVGRLFTKWKDSRQLPNPRATVHLRVYRPQL